MRQTKVSFWSPKARAPRFGEESKEEEEEKEEEEGEKAKPRYVFVLNSWVFWIPKVLVWRIVVPLSRVLWKEHPNP